MLLVTLLCRPLDLIPLIKVKDMLGHHIPMLVYLRLDMGDHAQAEHLRLLT